MKPAAIDDVPVTADSIAYALVQAEAEAEAEADLVSYENVRASVARWLQAAQDAPYRELFCRDERQDGFVESSLAALETVHHASSVLRRRQLAQFSERVKPRSRLQRALLDLFLTARLQRYVLAYASIQEGRDWDTCNTPYPYTSVLFRRTLSGLGRRSMAGLIVTFVGWSVRFNLDPLAHLRSAYMAHIRIHRAGPTRLTDKYLLSIRRTASILAFKTGAWGASAAAMSLMWLWGERTRADRLPRLIMSATCQREIATSIKILFPSSRILKDSEWIRLLDLISQYLSDAANSLFRVLPNDSKRDDGLAKLVKLAFGVIAGRVSERARHESDEVEFIYGSIRLAYSWGITYPLVDNIIDSPNTSKERRAALLAAIGAVFDDAASESLETQDELVREVVFRLREVMGFLNSENAKATRRTLKLLLTAHKHDSSRRLSALSERATCRNEGDIWADSVLKASLVRAATIQICGTELTPPLMVQQLMSGIVNQFGDDLWDARDDIEADRVTPFTVFLTREGKWNPFLFFTRYCAGLALLQSRSRRTAMYLGIQETSRCLIERMATAPP